MQDIVALAATVFKTLCLYPPFVPGAASYSVFVCLSRWFNCHAFNYLHTLRYGKSTAATILLLAQSSAGRCGEASWSNCRGPKRPCSSRRAACADGPTAVSAVAMGVRLRSSPVASHTPCAPRIARRPHNCVAVAVRSSRRQRLRAEVVAVETSYSPSIPFLLLSCIRSTVWPWPASLRCRLSSTVSPLFKP
jgi:hypothetical protein